MPSSKFGDDLTSEFLFDERMYVVAGTMSPSSRRQKIGLAELCHEPWLLPESDNIAMALISDAFRNAGSTPPAAQVVSNSMTLRVRLVETGKFIAIVPEFNFAVWDPANADQDPAHPASDEGPVHCCHVIEESYPQSDCSTVHR